MAGWSVPGLGEAARARLEEAGFTPESMARARPSELVKRARLRADLARRVIAHYRGEAPDAAAFTFRNASVGGRAGPVENGEEPAGAAPAPPAPNGEAPGAPPAGEGREWERVWDLGARGEQPGAPWRWRGRVVLKVSLGRGP